MGLLDMLQSDDPAVKQGLIQFGLGLLSSKGNFGNALGNAGQQGLAGALGYRDRQAQQKRAALQDQLTQGQIAQQGQQQKSFEQQQAEWAHQQELRNLPSQFVTQGMKPDTMDNRDVGMPGEQAIKPGPVDVPAYMAALQSKDFPSWLDLNGRMQKAEDEYSTTPQTDQAGRLFVSNKRGGIKYLSGPDGSPLSARDKPENVNGVWVNPYTTKPAGVAPQDPNKPFGYGPDGKMTPNELYQQFAKSTAKAGAANVSMSVGAEKAFSKDLGSAAAKTLIESQDAAQAAQGSLSNVASVRDAVGRGSVILGPGAQVRQTGMRVGQVLGIGSKESAGTLARTKEVEQGLASLELDAAQLMKGQGTITEPERLIIRKIAGGQIQDLTLPELDAGMAAIERNAQRKIDIHSQRLKQLPEGAVGGLAPFMETPQSGPKVRRFNTATGKFE